MLESLNLSPIAVLAALAISGGFLTAWTALVFPTRILIQDSTPIEQVKKGPLKRLDERIQEMGMDIDIITLFTRGLLIGAPIGALFIVLGMVVAGILMIFAGIYVYYEYLVIQQERFALRWKDELTNAMEDFIDGLGVTGNIVSTISMLSSSSPSPLMRPIFGAIYRYYITSSGGDGSLSNMSDILRKFAESRAYDPIWYQFFITLSEAEKRGGQIIAYIRDLIDASRQELSLLERYFSSLVQARIVGISYALFPLVTLFFFATLFPNDPEAGISFVNNTTLEGILIQIISVAGAILTWYSTRSIIQAGLNFRDQFKNYRLSFREEDVLI